MDPDQMDASQPNNGAPSTTTPPAAPAAAPAAPAGTEGGQQQGSTAPVAPAPTTAPAPAAAVQGQAPAPVQAPAPAPAAAAPAPAAPANAAPEAYEFSLPEEVSMSPEALKSYAEVAKELNLPQDQAQGILAKVAPHMLAHQAQAIEEVKAKWNDESINDKEFGGENLTQNLGIAKRAVDAFGTPELGDLLAKTGLASNPEIIRLLYRAGKAISPDGFIPSSGSAPASRRDAADILFGKS